MTVEGGESGRFDDGLSTTGADQLMADVFGDLRVRQARKGVVDGDALAQSLMDRFSQGIVEIRLAAEDQGKTVDRVIAVIHQHFNIIEDSGGEILRLIHCQQEGLAFLFIEMKNLSLDRVKHTRLSSLCLYTEDLAELPVKLHYADSGQADILHVIKIGIQGFGKTAQGKGFTHTRPGGKDADASGVFQVIQAVEHLLQVLREEPVFLFDLLFVKGVERQAVITQCGHHLVPPVLE